MTDFSNHLYEAIRHLRPAFRNIATSVEIRSARFDLNTGTRACLEYLSDHGDAPVPVIARSLMVERQYIQRNVNDLLARNLVTRKKNPKHKKSNVISLTRDGKTLVTEVKQAEADVLSGLQATISAQEINATIHVLSSLSEFFKTLNEEDKLKEEIRPND